MRDRRIVLLALHLATEWEKSIIEAWTPRFTEPEPHAREAINKCKRNIRKFNRIYKKLNQ